MRSNQLKSPGALKRFAECTKQPIEIDTLLALSGLSEIYVIPFPPSSSGGKWLVSKSRGVQPRWRRNGKELFYISPDWKMMAVEVNTQPVFRAGTPQPLFQTDMVDTGIRTGPLSWDLAPDGNRFLIISENPSDALSLTVALNWRAGIIK